MIGDTRRGLKISSDILGYTYLKIFICLKISWDILAPLVCEQCSVHTL